MEGQDLALPSHSRVKSDVSHRGFRPTGMKPTLTHPQRQLSYPSPKRTVAVTPNDVDVKPHLAEVWLDLSFYRGWTQWVPRLAANWSN